ncbi:hypothetical protein FZU13_25370, partial [Escherichia coli]|nr:hypothetical protein [Escherichia coli]
FCDACQGGGAYGKPATPGSSLRAFLPAHMFFCRFSPESVDNVASIPGHAFPARRSRTTERSESVSEEAEYLRAYLWHRTRHSCIF